MSLIMDEASVSVDRSKWERQRRRAYLENVVVPTVIKPGLIYNKEIREAWRIISSALHVKPRRARGILDLLNQERYIRKVRHGRRTTIRRGRRRR